MAVPDDLETVVRASISPLVVWGATEDTPNHLVVLRSPDSNCALATRVTATGSKAAFDARHLTGEIAGSSPLNLPVVG